jgi:phosphatidyl-myo-inositol dimannoside synthase
VRLTVVYDHRFVQAPDGSMWSGGNLGYPFLQRYLQVFDEVQIVCRQQSLAQLPSGLVLASGPGVTFAPVGNFEGGPGYLRHHRVIGRRLLDALTTASDDSAFLVRAPTLIGDTATRFFARHGFPYAVEVVGDPATVFGWGRPAGPVGSVLSTYLSAALRRQVRGATAVGYVPSPQLRQRYPASSRAVTEDYSSLALEDDAVVASPRRLTTVRSPLRLVTIGSMNWPYTGIDVLIEACRLLRDGGVDVNATVIGEGRLRSQYERQAGDAGLSDAVTFVGQVQAGIPIRERLDAADLFVLASVSEGLPRALIEAMARGLPSVGTTAGGIPGLLPPEHCAVPGDPTDLARVIRWTARSAEAMNAASKANLDRTSNFRASETWRRSARVYAALREAAERRLTA